MTPFFKKRKPLTTDETPKIPGGKIRPIPRSFRRIQNRGNWAVHRNVYLLRRGLGHLIPAPTRKTKAMYDLSGLVS